jgi:hypothetical protein
VLPGHVERAGDTEVDHPRSGQREQHVGRLQITVHDPSRVHRRQRRRDPESDPVQRGLVQRSAVRHRDAQRHAVDEFGDQVWLSRGRISVEHPRRTERRHSPRRRHLVREPGPELRVGGQFGVHDLHRDPRPAGQRPAEIDGAHPARAEPPVSPYRPIVRGSPGSSDVTAPSRGLPSMPVPT